MNTRDTVIGIFKIILEKHNGYSKQQIETENLAEECEGSELWDGIWDFIHKNNNEFTPVFVKTPPKGIELLVKSPEGKFYLASWRPSYNIFACQHKGEDSFDWEWKLID